MNQIASTKNGLPLLICTQLIFMICMPSLCSTGIVKREIETDDTTKLNWEPIKIANNTSINGTITTTTTTSTTKNPTTEISSSTTTVPSTTKSATTTTPRIYRRTTTEKHATTHATTEKYAELISIEPVTSKDDTEVVTDVDGVTTEEHRFDLSRYTSDYTAHINEQNDHNNTNQQLTNDFENYADNVEHTSDDNADYEHNFRGMVLTTPETAFFDEKHREYEQQSEDEKTFGRYQDDNKVTVKESDATERRHGTTALLNDINGNSTVEKKQSTYLNRAEVESTNYDVSAVERINRTETNATIPGEKKGKFMQEGSNVNLTLPSASEVWALASMKNVDHSKIQQGQFYNVSETSMEQDVIKDKNNIGTIETKQLADWVSVAKNNDFTNSSSVTTNTTNSFARIKEQLAELIRSGYNQGKNATASPTPSNSTYRGKYKYQTNPLITRDQDSASQENQIIAVRLTTLPPPIVLTHNASRTTSVPFFTRFKDSQNKIDSTDTPESTTSVTTDVHTEIDDVEPTTIQTQSVDNSQNELKTKFQMENVTRHWMSTVGTAGTTEADPTTTVQTQQLTTETEQKADSVNIDEISTTQAYETTTLLTTTEPVPFGRTSTENELTTTSHLNLETEYATNVDEDRDHTTLEQTTTTAGFENEILQTQSSTLHPQYVELEKTSETRRPTTEFVAPITEFVSPTTEFVAQTTEFVAQTTEFVAQTTEFVAPTTEFVAPTTKPTTTVTTEKATTYNVRRKENNKLETTADNAQELTTTIINLNRDEDKYSTIRNHVPDETTQTPQTIEPVPVTIEGVRNRSDSPAPDIGEYSLDEPDTNTIIAISVSVVGVVVIAGVLAVLFVLRKRKKQLTYGQRCRPVGLDAYSLDNVSVYNSVRRKGMLRQSKRSYGNAAFDDPGLKNNLLTGAALTAFAQKKNEIYDEFKELPAVTARAEEVPVGCEDKNRYANIVPLPETRVYLKRIGDDETTEYINANFVKGPKDSSQYYIACQGPLESTIIDFWRMIWEQNSRVIIMATDLIENGIEQCSEYLPPSFVIDSHVTFGDFHITLKLRDVKEKYAVSMVHLKNLTTNTWREITHFWYQWPDTGVPPEQASIIQLLLEARGYLKVTTSEQIDDNENSQSNNGNLAVGNGSVDKSKSLLRTQGPLTVHCSPGTGRTGTIIACDIALRTLEQPTRSVDIPQIVYSVRRGRASAVRTREQYEFIYKVANVYAAKLTGPATEN